MIQSDREQTSRISGFYRRPLEERVAFVAEWANLASDEVTALEESLSLAQADHMIENVAGRYALPLGLATNFLINSREILIPMVIEEPSVVAAVSYAAKLARAGGGFQTGSTESVMIGQVQLLDVSELQAAAGLIEDQKQELLSLADTSSSISARGGGPKDIVVRVLEETPTQPMLVVHLFFDARDAMGANAVNTAVEAIAPRLEELSGGRALLRILSNLSDQRRAWASVRIPAVVFETATTPGDDVVAAIADANAFAVADPYRAATHNKGIMNGIDAVALATGNDWRAIEAGAHAFAARDGQYRALSDWHVETENGGGLDVKPVAAGNVVGRANRSSSESDMARREPVRRALYGRIEVPLAVGTVGGATKAHPTASVALKVLGVEGARELAEVMVAVGLAQNLAALRALVTDGIQRGHMALHARQVALSAGASPDEVEAIARQLVLEEKIREERARQILAELHNE